MLDRYIEWGGSAAWRDSRLWQAARCAGGGQERSASKPALFAGRRGCWHQSCGSRGTHLCAELAVGRELGDAVCHGQQVENLQAVQVG